MLSEWSDANCLADAIVFLSTHETGRNVAFNVTNGDCFRWSQLLATARGAVCMPCGVPRGIKLAKWMADKGPVWDRIVARRGLDPRPLDSLASREFGDFFLEKQWDLLTISAGCGARFPPLHPQHRDDPQTTEPVSLRETIAEIGGFCSFPLARITGTP